MWHFAVVLCLVLTVTNCWYGDMLTCSTWTDYIQYEKPGFENERWNLVFSSSRKPKKRQFEERLEILLDQPTRQQIDGVPHMKVVLERLVHWTCCPDNGMSDITRLRHVPLTALALVLHPRSTDKTNNQLQSIIPPLFGSSQGGQTSLFSPGCYVITF